MKNFNKWIVVPYCSFQTNTTTPLDKLGSIVNNKSLSTNQRVDLYNQQLTKELNDKPQEQIERFNNALLNKEQTQIQHHLVEPEPQPMPERIETRESRPEGQIDNNEEEQMDQGLPANLNKSYNLRMGFPYRVNERNITKRKRSDSSFTALKARKNKRLKKSLLKEKEKENNIPSVQQPLQSQNNVYNGKIKSQLIKARFTPYNNNY